VRHLLHPQVPLHLQQTLVAQQLALRRQLTRELGLKARHGVSQPLVFHGVGSL